MSGKSVKKMRFEGNNLIAYSVQPVSVNGETVAAIEEMIGNINAVTSSANKMSSSLSQSSFESIDNQVGVVEPLVRQISSAMEEQSEGSTQIL